MGMSDLGEPGFNEEVALSRRAWGSYARLVATIDSAGSGAGESQKAESVDSARERSQLRQPRSNNVPSDSQQTDRWQDMFHEFFSRKVFIQLLDLLPHDDSNLANDFRLENLLDEVYVPVVSKTDIIIL